MPLIYPEWDRPCRQCREYIHDDDGRIKLNLATRELIRRPAASSPPCQLCPKIPPGALRKHWDYAVEMTPEMEKINYHYRVCKAVGRFPADPLVELCAVLISEAERSAERICDGRSESRMASLVNAVTSTVLSRTR